MEHHIIGFNGGEHHTVSFSKVSTTGCGGVPNGFSGNAHGGNNITWFYR